jgi:RNA 2',3'-cyclic 3'-phosphodiesterase
VRPKRLFVSLELPESVTALLVRLDPGLPGVRWLSPDQIHLTLAFLGNVDAEKEERLRANLSAIQFGSFFLPLHGLGTFPAKGDPKILWIGVGRGHPHLFQLHKKVSDAALGAGLEPDLRPWHPHMTLARCQNISASALRPFLREYADYDAGLVPVNEFHLKSSLLTPAGSIHTTELTVHA